MEFVLFAIFAILVYGLFMGIEMLFCLVIGLDEDSSFLLRFMLYIREKVINTRFVERIRDFYED